MLLWLAGKAGYVCGHAAVAAAIHWFSLVRFCWLQRKAGPDRVGAHW